MANPADMFGKAKYGGNRFRNHKLKDGKNKYRIGPPYKSLAAEGRWFYYTRQHFGYYGTDAKDDSKTVARPFLCPLEIDRRTEMVKRPCKECDKIEQQKELLAERTAAEQAAGRSDDEIKKITGSLVAWLKSHNVDKKYNVIAKNEKGEWGTLPLPYKAKEAFDLRKKELLDQGIDPLDIENGVWFVFTRSGEGLKTVYTCDIEMEVEIVNGKRQMSYKMDTMTEADFKDIQDNCPDLSTLGRPLTQEQISMLVSGSGDPEEVDRIFQQSQKAETSASKKREATPAPAPVVKAPPKSLPPAVSGFHDIDPEPETPAATPEAPTSAPEVDDEEAALLAALEANRAKKAAAAAAAAAAKVAAETKQPTPTLGGIDPKKLPDSDFAALFKNQIKK
jgi:hypothetical protein